jgi:hypothetical protein
VIPTHFYLFGLGRENSFALTPWPDTVALVAANCQGEWAIPSLVYLEKIPLRKSVKSADEKLRASAPSRAILLLK